MFRSCLSAGNPGYLEVQKCVVRFRVGFCFYRRENCRGTRRIMGGLFQPVLWSLLTGFMDYFYRFRGLFDRFWHFKASCGDFVVLAAGDQYLPSTLGVGV